MNELALTRARRGAAYLDRKLGRAWRRRIRRSRLNMGNSCFRVDAGPTAFLGRCGCIFAQLDASQPHKEGVGYYAEGVEELATFDATGSTACRLGFLTSGQKDAPTYAELTEAWKTVLRDPVES